MSTHGKSTGPTLPPIWAAFLSGLRAKGLAPDGQLSAVERAGAAPEVVAALVAQLWFPRSKVTRCAMYSEPERELAPEEKLARSSWAIRFLDNPEPVIAVLGHSLMDVYAFRLASLHPSHWLDGKIHLGLEPELILASIERGLMFLSPIAPLDLRWMKTLNGSLEISYPIWPPRLPRRIRCRDLLHLRGVQGIVHLQGSHIKGEGAFVLIENCPDLTDLELPRATTVEIRSCPALQRIWGRAPQGGLHVEGCTQLQQVVLTIPKSLLSRPNIAFKDCPSLIRLESMGRTRRVIGDLTLAGCPSLQPPLLSVVVMGRLSVPDNFLPGLLEGQVESQDSR